jgi:hypothetical protein
MRRIATLAAAGMAGLVAAGVVGCSPRDRTEEAQPHAASDSTAQVRERPATTPGHDRMVAVLADIARRTDAENPFVGNRAAVEARAELEALDPNAPPPRRWQLLCRSGSQELRIGNERAAIECLEQAVAMADQVRGSVPPRAIHETLYRLGVACIRFGETENCCLRNSPESCILPIQAGGIHDRTEGSRRAIQHLTELLGAVPAGSPLALKARWLLNIAFMTLGEWPEHVPAHYLIPPSVFASEEDFPRFPNVARALGVDMFNLSGGAIAEDFDGDGDLDLLTSTADTRGPMHYSVNEGAVGFVDRTEEAGLTGLFGGLNMVHADYDNDGNTDVLVLRGAWLGLAGLHPKSLLRNRGDGTFEDVTFAAGLGERAFPTQTASWADYDLDGDLDLYVGAESTIELDVETFPQGGRERMREPGELFRNEGDGTFVDVAAAAGVENLRFAKGVVWGDYDEDRYPDLYVSNLGSENRLYRNRGDGTFEDVAPRLGVTGPRASFPCWFWDYDNDGDRDLYVALFDGSSDALANVAASYLGAKMKKGYAPCLYRNDGGRFAEVAAEQGIDRVNLTMGANFGDVDGDGWLDFYLGTGYPDYEALDPNVMYRNRGGTGFSDVTVAGGFGHLQKGHAIVFADLDNDGDEDVFAQLGGAFPGDAYGDALFLNPGFDRRFLTVKLVGVRSNRSAIGARIRVDVVEQGRARTIWRDVSSGGSFGANPLRQTIGLGSAASIERLSIFWPATDRTQEFRDVPLDSFVEIEEDSDELRVLPIVGTPFSPSPGAPRL